MAQVLEIMKTFFIEMTKNGDIVVSNDGIDLQKQVKEVQAQETRDIDKMEKEVEEVYIPLEDEIEGFVDRAAVNEKEANETAIRKQMQITTAREESQMEK